METNTDVNFKERLQQLIVYQDVLARNSLLAQRTCDQEFHTFLTFHNDFRRKYTDLRAYADQLDRYVEQYRKESTRKDKKLQSQSSQILRLTQHNKRNNERLTELQRCLDQIKGKITGQNTYDQLLDILRDSIMSENETTADLSDKNCTAEELDGDNLHIPKVVSQSTDIGGIKRSSPCIIETTTDKNDFNNRPNPDQLTSSRHSLSIHKRPKQKIRKPSKEFLNTKSEESELSTDDVFWSKHKEKPPQPPIIYPTLPKLTSPPSEQKTLTPSTPNGIIKASPSSINTLHARTHIFISRNILIPETCCVCFKRINFGKLAYRCQACYALCHTGCKENCTTLCLSNIKTPNRGIVSKFSPRESNQLQIPAFLVHCIKEIEQRGLQEVGIYRLNVAEDQVKELKERLLKSHTNSFDLSHYNDIHLICGVVKDFLRSLSESLLTDVLWKSFASIVEEEFDLIKYQQKFNSLIQQLPKSNRDTLAFIILHLQRVAASPFCRMPITNLSRTMGPIVIGYSSKHISSVDNFGETYKQTKILEFLLKIPSNYWIKFLENNDSNELLITKNKQQISTPILIRQHTPTITYPAPSNIFFSPI